MARKVYFDFLYIYDCIKIAGLQFEIIWESEFGIQDL